MLSEQPGRVVKSGVQRIDSEFDKILESVSPIRGQPNGLIGRAVIYI